MNVSIAALLAGARDLDDALTSLRAEPATTATTQFFLGCRDARTLKEQCALHDATPLHSALQETGPFGDLARLIGSDDAKRDGRLSAELVSLGVDPERAAIFDRTLIGEKMVLVARSRDADEAIVRALLRVEADFGLENGSGAKLTVPLRREVLDVIKTVVADRDVTVRTDVVVETQRLEIQLEREEIVIEQRDLSVADGAVVVTRIPIKHEEAILQKRVVVTAEVRVRTEQHVESSVVHEELRHEIFLIDDEVEMRVHDTDPPHA